MITNKLAVIAALLGAVVLLASALAGLGSRWGWWHFSTGFSILRWAVYASFVVALIALIALFRRGRWPLALFGLLAALIIIGNALLQRRKAQHAAPIHDITTSTEDPPEFVDVLPLRANARNQAEYGGPEVGQKQHATYPDIQPLHLDVPPEQAFARAREVAEDEGWEIVAAEPAEGRLEATARTFWFGFYDDVVVRIRPEGSGSVVDVRSVSRVGGGDLGANAARIREFLEEMRG